MFNGEYMVFMFEELLGEDGSSGDVVIDSKYGSRVSFFIVLSDCVGLSLGMVGW